MLRLENLSILFAAKLIRLPLWVALSVLLARYLGPEGMGRWSLILAGAMFISTVFLQWTQPALLYFGRPEWLRDHSLSQTYAARFPLLLGGLLLALVFIAVDPWTVVTRVTRLAGPDLYLVILLGVGLWALTEVQTVLNVLERFVALGVVPMLGDLAWIAVLLVFMFWRGSGDEQWSEHVIFWMALLPLLVFGGHLALVWGQLGLTPALPAPGAVKSVVVYAWPLLPGFLIGYTSEWLNHLLISASLGQREVGYFHPAYQYMFVMAGLATTVANVLQPRVIGLYPNSRPAVEMTLQRVIPQLAILWLLPIILGISIAPTLMAWLLGPEFRASADLFRILLAAVPGAVFLHAYSTLFTAESRLGRSSVMYFGISATLNLLLFLALVPVFGTAAAAYAAVAAFYALQWLHVADQHRRHTIAYGTSGLLLAGVQLYGLLQLLLVADWARLLLAALVCALVCALARGRGIFSADEVQSILPRGLGLFQPLLTKLLLRSAREKTC